ncbi:MULTISPECIES: DUF4360 domain-containing protein [Nostocaceae]|uniref:DUF4360 domain-containing protein n=2 Tax=Nostocaceae TaxID=1162 RepID=A0A3S1APF8_ANAVA|nr:MULTISPECIES: DUF4360 domain-containing protein [Nostocaceae]RUS96759.1 hypothetical protein DSM107003_21650 [Trichormus variabilis SAG 1403-4b]
MNFAKVFLATATLMVASISPIFADSISPTSADPINLSSTDSTDTDPNDTEPSIPPSASNKIEIIGGEYFGTGCPENSASTTVSPDGNELSILFDKFIALGGDAENQEKSCKLTIPIKAPQGKQISLHNADYRGYVSPNTTGELRVEYVFADSDSLVLTERLKGETDYKVRHKLKLEGKSRVWSACGASVNMEVNAAMKATGTGQATVDSFDLARRGLVYKVKYRNCK